MVEAKLDSESLIFTTISHSSEKISSYHDKLVMRGTCIVNPFSPNNSLTTVPKFSQFSSRSIDVHCCTSTCNYYRGYVRVETTAIGRQKMNCDVGHCELGLNCLKKNKLLNKSTELPEGRKQLPSVSLSNCVTQNISFIGYTIPLLHYKKKLYL